MELSEQARVQCENWGIDADALVQELCEMKLTDVGADVPWYKVPVDMGDTLLSVIIQDGKIDSVKQTENVSVNASRPVPPLSEHAKKRMRERGVTMADIEEAWAHKRGRGAKHVGTRATIIVGTLRGKGETIVTVYRTE